ncbi:cellulose biosynthesis protein BcsN [Aurantimonas aggregata]|uniref:Cellulose biosynthesis protein BcsN n=1 Tax=Aurantimonas aggregata TaxID=2047720 RepID=A0A6L9MG10_9HYPH|nr:cellulose biosynthesis protein BcsN [Aurantimonas aggregata]NDV86733.1 cellulose biosynthesis protein BcsN [Aurantimonas aggregata]
MRAIVKSALRRHVRQPRVGWMAVSVARRARALAVIASAALASGCGAVGQPITASSPTIVSAEQAFALPPVGGPAVIAVVEQRFPNATEHKILLRSNGRSPGENYLLAQFFGPVGTTGLGRENLRNRPLAITNISTEMREAFPGVAMARSAIFVQNDYGPFGYAIGRALSGDTCVYAWQRIAGTPRPPLIFRSNGAIELRLRLCDAGASEATLLSVMYGVRIRAFFAGVAWNPYGAPPSPDAAIGQPGAPIYPTGIGGYEPVLADAPVRPTQPTRTRPARRAASPAPTPAPVAVPAVEPLPAPVGPPIPLPPSAQGAAPVTPAETPAATAVPGPPTVTGTSGAAATAAPAATPAPASGPAPLMPSRSSCTPAQKAAGAC